MKKYCVVVLLIVCGCSHDFRYTKPTSSYDIKNSIIIDKPKDIVWPELVSALSGTFFVINNIDKDSGLINVDCSGNPEQFVDCGKIYSSIQNLAGKRIYNFPAAIAYKEYEIWTNTLTPVKRKMEFSGKINIIVKEAGKEKTEIAVNTKYVILKTTQQLMAQNYGMYAATNWVTNTDSASFTTKDKSGSFSVGDTTCKCNGKLEQMIFDLAKSID